MEGERETVLLGKKRSGGGQGNVWVCVSSPHNYTFSHRFVALKSPFVTAVEGFYGH